MSEIIKPIATDETLQKVAAAITNSDTVKAQKAEIQAEGQRVLNTIPQDYQETVKIVEGKLCKNLVGLSGEIYYPCYLPDKTVLTMSTADGEAIGISNLNLILFDENLNDISDDGWNFNANFTKRTITLNNVDGKTAKFMRWNKNVSKAVQVEYGDTATEYQPYFNINKTFQTNIVIIFKQEKLPTITKNGFTITGSSGFYISDISNSSRIDYTFEDVSTQIPDYATWDADTETFTLTLTGEKTFGIDLATRKCAVVNYVRNSRPESFVTLYWVYYEQYGGIIAEQVATRSIIDNRVKDRVDLLCSRDFSIIFTNSTVVLDVGAKGFKLVGDIGLYIANRAGKDRTKYLFNDIVSQVGESYASYDSDSMTFTLNIGGEQSFGFDVSTDTFKVMSLNSRPESFVTLYWVYYEQYGGIIAEQVFAKNFNEKKDTYCTSDEIQDRTFNAAYHTGAQKFADVCRKYSMLFNGDETNDIAAVDKCEAFLWFTDPHVFTDMNGGIPKMEEYIAQLQKYYNSTPTTFVLCGGDWLGNSDTPDMACYKMGYIDGICRSMFDKCYMLVGNHDTNYQGKKDTDSATWTTRLSRTAIRNLWYRDIGRAYYDFEGINTHFYCFDTGTENQALTHDNDYGYEQALWFAENLLKETHPHIAMAAHIYYYNDDTVQPLTKLLFQIASSYNNRTTIVVKNKSYDFTDATGRVEFMMAGHNHKDYTLVDSRIPVIATLDCGNSQTYTDDCSFDLVFVDYDSRKIKCIRAGVGEDREINLDD